MNVTQETRGNRSGAIGLSLLTILVLLSGCRTTVPSESSTAVLSLGHAHNDYENEHPLNDALNYGFASIEADVHLVNGRLLVAHDAHEVNPANTLEALYLDPLKERFIANRGAIRDDGAPLILLIDFKTESEATYRALDAVLQNYRSMLTRFVGGNTLEGSVSVIISGNRPTRTLAGQKDRLAAIDGRLPDLKHKTYPASLVPLISDDWKKHFSWNGIGDCPISEQSKLASLVTQAHLQGQLIRFWGNPDLPSYWKLARDNDVDLINTDNLAGLSEFLKSKPAPTSE